MTAEPMLTTNPFYDLSMVERAGFMPWLGEKGIEFWELSGIDRERLRTEYAESLR